MVVHYSYQEEQTLSQAQGSAIAQALTIKESLRQMMTENERVDDAFLVHDFRGPLTAIGVGLEMLKNDELASRKKHDLYEQVRTAMERMT